MKTFAEMAHEFYHALISDTRTDGTTFYRLADGSPEWMRDACREAHDGEGPNDWRYDTIDSLLERIEDYADPDDVDHGDIADGLVTIYNAERTAWLAGNLERATYCDEAADELGCEGGIFDRIGWGMYLCIEEMSNTIVRAIADAVREQEEVEA